jgi:hypothetical protein
MMDIHQDEIRSQYEEVRRQRAKLPPWDELDDDLVFAVLRAYEAGARRAAKQPEQGSKDQQAAPARRLRSTTEALAERMFDAVVRELRGEVPPNGVVDLFKGIPQHTARLAIARQASRLLTRAVWDDLDELGDSGWKKLLDEFRDEMDWPSE